MIAKAIHDQHTNSFSSGSFNRLEALGLVAKQKNSYDQGTCSH
jgi:hypothetical protein